MSFSLYCVIRIVLLQNVILNASLRNVILNASHSTTSF